MGCVPTSTVLGCDGAGLLQGLSRGPSYRCKPILNLDEGLISNLRCDSVGEGALMARF